MNNRIVVATAKVLVYGTGQVADMYAKLIPPQWECLAFIDSDPQKQGRLYAGGGVIDSPRNINTYNFDFIIILSKRYNEEIKDELYTQQIPPHKIIDFHQFWKLTNVGSIESNFINFALKRNSEKFVSHVFDNRGKGKSKLFYVLAGYREALWNDVFERVDKFVHDDIDICLLDNGKQNDSLRAIAKKYGWSYLSLAINNAAIAQNIVISKFPNAKIIYKMDEDIFLTKNCCKKMEYTYNVLSSLGNMKIGIVGPTINNHSSDYIFFQYFHLDKLYKKVFGRSHFMGEMLHENFYKRDNADYERFVWSIGNIDDLNRQMENNEIKYQLSPIYYGIGLIMFSKKLYCEMGGFDVNLYNNGLGKGGDEGQIMRFCNENGLVNVVCTDVLCGHLSFSGHYHQMLEFMYAHREYFKLVE